MDLVFQVAKLFLYFSNEEADFSVQNLEDFFRLLLTSTNACSLHTLVQEEEELQLSLRGLGENFCMKLLENCTGK